MTQSTTEMIRRLLQPTHDLAGWRAEFEALDVGEAVSVLIGILKDEVEPMRTRSEAATLLGMLHNTRANDALLEALRAPDGLLRARAALALGQIGNPGDREVQSLIQGLSDEDYFVREVCAKALQLMKRQEALPALERMSTTDSVWTNREIALKAIAAIRGTT